MRIQAVVFPFDSFGSGGTAAGARLLGDLLREIIEDTRRESRPVRQKAFVGNLHIEDIAFDDPAAINGWLETGAIAARKVLKSDFAIWLSGNHLGCKPVYDVLSDETLVVQLDAHLDCYDLHDTQDTLSHGNFLRAVSNPIVNIGHRDLFLKRRAIAKYLCDVHSAESLAVREPQVFETLKRHVEASRQVWLDLDFDVLDPSIFPAVHQPLPFGLFGHHLLRIFEVIGFEKLRGVSFSEFDPGRDQRDRSLEFAGWLIEWLLLKKCGA